MAEQPPTPPAPHFVGVYWRYFWNAQRYTATHLFRDYPERGYQNPSPEGGRTLCGEVVPDYYREGLVSLASRATCRRCAKVARKLLQEATT